MSGPGPDHQWADTSSRTLGAYSQRPQDPAPPFSGGLVRPALALDLVSLTSVGHQLRDTLGPSASSPRIWTPHQWANRSFRMPQTPQPAVSGTDPAYQQADTSSGTPRALQPEILGHNFTHQYASTSPRKPWALAPPTSRTMLGSELPWTVIQHHKDFIPTNQWPAATVKSRT